MTGGSVTTRASRRKDQPSSTNKDNDDDDDGDDEPMLQTQLQLTTQQEREDEDNDDEDNDDDEEYEDENVKDTKPRQGPGSASLKRTARKTVSHGTCRKATPQKKSDTLVIEDNEEEEEDYEEEEEDNEEEEEEAAPEITVKPEDSEVIENSGTEADPNVTKRRINTYYNDILDHEQNKILFDRSERITSWPTLQVRFVSQHLPYACKAF